MVWKQIAAVADVPARSLLNATYSEPQTLSPDQWRRVHNAVSKPWRFIGVGSEGFLETAQFVETAARVALRRSQTADMR